MKRLVALGLLFGAIAGITATHALVQPGTASTVQPYHQESSITAVRTAHGYRIVKAAPQSRQ